MTSQTGGTNLCQSVSASKDRQRMSESQTGRHGAAAVHLWKLASCRQLLCFL